jgi:hypothetical protein
MRRALQAAAEKHSALGGLSGACRKRDDAAAKREQAKADAAAEAKTRLEALLTAHGVEHGSAAWRALGKPADEVDAFLKGHAPHKSKKRKGSGGDRDAGAIKTADDAEGARHDIAAGQRRAHPSWST